MRLVSRRQSHNRICSDKFQFRLKEPEGGNKKSGSGRSLIGPQVSDCLSHMALSEKNTFSDNAVLDYLSHRWHYRKKWQFWTLLRQLPLPKEGPKLPLFSDNAIFGIIGKSVFSDNATYG